MYKRNKNNYDHNRKALFSRRTIKIRKIVDIKVY